MKKPLIILILVAFSTLFLSAQNLSYTRITNGLNMPEFEGGRSDCRFDDINMDGHPDIITMGDHGNPGIGSNQHGIIVWFGDGQGNFQNFMTGNLGYGGIAVGDVNNDGMKDIGYGIHHNYSSTDLGDQLLEVALGDGTGMNWTPWDDGLAEEGQDWGMFGTDFGDVDNDGDLDLVSISFGSGDGLHVYLNQGDGSWVHSFGYLNGNSDMLVEFGDLNKDGFLDFISGHESGTAFFGNGTGNFENKDAGLPVLGTFDTRMGISAGDINNDGATDLAFGGYSTGVHVYCWDENEQTWIDWSNGLPTTGAIDFTRICDMNSDGNADVVAISGQNIKIWLGNGQGNWTLDAQFSLGGNAGPQFLRCGGDIDHNGRPDIALLAEIGSWPSYQNEFFCFKESSSADSLWIEPAFPKGGEAFFPGSVQFIDWASEVPGGALSTIKIEISAFGPDGPWWLVAESLPNNGRHQWTVPNLGSDNVYLKFTITDDVNIATSMTRTAFQVIGNPTSVKENLKNTHVWIYPNPGNNHLEIYNHQKVEKIQLSDIHGSFVLSENKPQSQIEVSHLEPGVYFYQLWLNDGSVKTGKWFKILK